MPRLLSTLSMRYVIALPSQEMDWLTLPSPFYVLIGVDKPRSYTGDSKKVSEVTVQNMRSPQPASQITADRVT